MTTIEEDEGAAAAFAAFNDLVGGDEDASPYAMQAELLAAGPVHPGVPELGVENVEGQTPAFSIYGYDAVTQAYSTPEVFSSAVYADLTGPVMGRAIIEMDPPEHREYRMLLQQSFSKAEMVRWRHEVADPILKAIVEEIRPAGRAELVGDVLFEYPVRTIAGMIGLPPETHRTFHRLAMELIAGPVDPDRAMRAASTMAELCAPELADRRRQPRGDMLSILAEAEHEGQSLTDEEIYSFIRLLLPAGAETTYRSSGNLLVGLFDHRDQLELLLDERDRFPVAIDEGLRWETPLLVSPRVCAQDTTFFGTDIPAGAGITLSIASANHDASRWDDPERFDITRPRKGHLAFGYQTHMCLGLHLAKMETQALIEALFDGLPNLRPDPDAPPPSISGSFMRSPRRLDVVWDS